jgi:hypothetical protein
MNRRSIGADTLFEIGSVTKVSTALSGTRLGCGHGNQSVFGQGWRDRRADCVNRSRSAEAYRRRGALECLPGEFGTHTGWRRRLSGPGSTFDPTGVAARLILFCKLAGESPTNGLDRRAKSLGSLPPYQADRWAADVGQRKDHKARGSCLHTSRRDTESARLSAFTQ